MSIIAAGNPLTRAVMYARIKLWDGPEASKPDRPSGADSSVRSLTYLLRPVRSIPFGVCVGQWWDRVPIAGLTRF